MSMAFKYVIKGSLVIIQFFHHAIYKKNPNLIAGIITLECEHFLKSPKCVEWKVISILF
jgi:hypothetical protein